MTRKNIISALIRFARAIGRWLLKFAAEHGATWLAGYMVGRIGDFGRRLARAKTRRRKAWLRGRIDRWQVALAWLKEHGSEAARDVIDEADRMAESWALPMVAATERAAA